MARLGGLDLVFGVTSGTGKDCQRHSSMDFNYREMS